MRHSRKVDMSFSNSDLVRFVHCLTTHAPPSAPPVAQLLDSIIRVSIKPPRTARSSQSPPSSVAPSAGIAVVGFSFWFSVIFYIFLFLFLPLVGYSLHVFCGFILLWRSLYLELITHWR
jgi:hypothetical protein